MVRTSSAPTIDGVLDDEVWKNAPVANKFVEWTPTNGALEPEGFESEVKILYDDEAMYFGALLRDPNPDQILKELAQRDDNNRNASWFAVWINPYKDGQSDINFFVTAAGVQTDSRTTDFGDDVNWNAVWDSEVTITEEGWVVEMAIPYAALRFPETPVQTWNLNLGRSIRRDRKTLTWSYINNSVGRPEIYAGYINNISNLESPLRLSLLPYISGYLNRFDGSNSYEYNLGLDLKYGLSESFTLDMTLIPDFGQVAFDNQVLNLSPFEVRFDENRQFFTEGTELFNKGGLFYSRRIGDRPTRMNEVFNELEANEEVIDNPNKVQLLNATKVSGRTAQNLGIGFFNAVTANTYATIENTETEEQRQFLTESVANYNVLVLDQRFGRNNSVTLVNTNVTRYQDFRDANSSAFLFNLNNEANTYNFDGGYKQSLVWNNGEQTYGFNTYGGLAKTSGNWRYNAGFNLESDSYNPNDLGFLFNNNEFSQWIGGSYQIFTPTRTFNNYGVGANINLNYLYNPREFSSFNYNTWGWFTLKSFDGFGFNVWGTPVERQDWFEARTPGRQLNKMPNLGGNIWVSTDYRKRFALDFGIDGTLAQTYRTVPVNSSWGSVSVSPRFRFNDQISMVYRIRYSADFGDYGFIGNGSDGEIYMGERNIRTTVNTLTGAYIFNNKMSMKLNFRHYLSNVDYIRAFALDDDGYLQFDGDAGIETDLPNRDLNLNFWNIDLIYSWWFAPGSEISLVWKNSISTFRSEVVDGYFNNVGRTFEEPVNNSFSIKILYFIDGGKILSRR